MTAVEVVREVTHTGLPLPANEQCAIFGQAILELAARLAALEAEKPKHAPCAQCGNEAVILGKYVAVQDGRILCPQCAMDSIEAKSTRCDEKD